MLTLAGAVSAEPRFRADDGNLWRLNDNPALPAVSGDTFAFGAAVAPAGDSWTKGTNQLQLVSPFLSFDYAWAAAGSSLKMGSALGPWEGFALGYQAEDRISGNQRESLHHFGVVYRPFDALSAAVTVDDAFGPQRLWGAGLAFRPLALGLPGAEALTLTADGAWKDNAAVWERWGARFAWNGSDVRVWYEPGKNVPGFEVTLALGPGETTASPLLAAQAFRWSAEPSEIGVWGPVILRVKVPGVLTASPAPQGPLWGTLAGRDLPGLMALLARAASDPAVQAVAFEAPPLVAGLASAQELRQALQKLGDAGKKVYVHANSYDDGTGFAAWIAAADRVSLHPTGSVVLTAGGTRRLYLKDFFDKVGVKFVNFAPWETKSANNALTYSSMPEGERAMFRRLLADRDAMTAEALAEGRKDRLKGSAADLIARGPWLVAQEALDNGLVDALESEADFEDFLLGEHPGASFVDDLIPPRNRAWGPSLAKKTAALVHLSGDILPGAGQAAASIGTAASEALRALRQDASVHAILIRVDSPGGAVTPSDLLAEEVRKAVEGGKPVVVVMGDVAASGGYYLAAPASRIFARPGTITGSIGVTAAVFTGEKALDLLGIRADGFDLAPSAAFGDWTRNVTETDAQKWSGMIEAIYQRFLDVVAAGRRLDKAKLEPLARGQVYTGREALALGLVDELGGQDAAEAWLENELGGPVEFFDVIPGETNLWSGLLGQVAQATVKATNSPTLKLAASIDAAAAPWAEAVAGLAARGPGPLVWMEKP